MLLCYFGDIYTILLIADKKPGMTAISTGNLESIEPEDGGFTPATMEMRQSRRSLANSRNGHAGIYARYVWWMKVNPQRWGSIVYS